VNHHRFGGSVLLLLSLFLFLSPPIVLPVFVKKTAGAILAHPRRFAEKETARCRGALSRPCNRIARFSTETWRRKKTREGGKKTRQLRGVCLPGGQRVSLFSPLDTRMHCIGIPRTFVPRFLRIPLYLISVCMLVWSYLLLSSSKGRSRLLCEKDGTISRKRIASVRSGSDSTI